MNKQTYTYKVVGNCEIQADVYEASGRPPRPAILFLHGGALILGSREGIHPGQLDRYLNAGYALISVDYRLAPETKLPAIIEDVQDAVRGQHQPGEVACVGQLFRYHEEKNMAMKKGEHNPALPPENPSSPGKTPKPRRL